MAYRAKPAPPPGAPGGARKPAPPPLAGAGPPSRPAPPPGAPTGARPPRGSSRTDLNDHTVEVTTGEDFSTASLRNRWKSFEQQAAVPPASPRMGAFPRAYRKRPSQANLPVRSAPAPPGQAGPPGRSAPPPPGMAAGGNVPGSRQSVGPPPGRSAPPPPGMAAGGNVPGSRQSVGPPPGRAAPAPPVVSNAPPPVPSRSAAPHVQVGEADGDMPPPRPTRANPRDRWLSASKLDDQTKKRLTMAPGVSKYLDAMRGQWNKDEAPPVPTRAKPQRATPAVPDVPSAEAEDDYVSETAALHQDDAATGNHHDWMELEASIVTGITETENQLINTLASEASSHPNRHSVQVGAHDPFAQAVPGADVPPPVPARRPSQVPGDAPPPVPARRPSQVPGDAPPPVPARKAPTGSGVPPPPAGDAPPPPPSEMAPPPPPDDSDDEGEVLEGLVPLVEQSMQKDEKKSRPKTMMFLARQASFKFDLPPMPQHLAEPGSAAPPPPPRTETAKAAAEPKRRSRSGSRGHRRSGSGGSGSGRRRRSGSGSKSKAGGEDAAAAAAGKRQNKLMQMLGGEFDPAHPEKGNIDLPSHLATPSGELDTKELTFDYTRPDKPMIRAGTEQALFDRLFDKRADKDYIQQVMLTVRVWSTPARLLEEIRKRCRCEGITKDADKLLTRLSLVKVLKDWTSNHFYDFTSEEGRSLLAELVYFIDNELSTYGSAMAKSAHLIRTTIEKRLERKDEGVVVFTKKPPKPFIPKNLRHKLGFMDLHPEEIARQLTLIDFKLYCEIKPPELLNQNWNNRKRKEELAPHILAMIYRFNDVSRWVADCIVQEADLKQRAVVMHRMIIVASRLRALNNYNGVMAMLAGLSNSAVYRLKKTWHLLPEKSLEIHDELNVLMSREGNFKDFREALHTSNPPAIPYLGTYLTDLTFITDGNPDELPPVRTNDPTLINFYKHRLCAEVIREIQQYQQTPYCLEPLVFVQDYLTKYQPLDEDALHELSQKNEPREKKKKKKPAA